MPVRWGIVLVGSCPDTSQNTHPCHNKEKKRCNIQDCYIWPYQRNLEERKRKRKEKKGKKRKKKKKEFVFIVSRVLLFTISLVHKYTPVRSLRSSNSGSLVPKSTKTWVNEPLLMPLLLCGITFL